MNCMNEKRPMQQTYKCGQRPLKETYIYETRPIKETYAYEKRPTREKRPMVFSYKRDLHI